MTERPLLVLLHGWGASAAVWQPVVERLQADYTCYLPELPGHGNSLFTETQLAPLARQILATVNRPAIWLGWSLGALVAMQAALLMSQQVRQLLMVSGTPAFVQHVDWSNAMPLATFDEFQRDFSADTAKTLKHFIALQALGDGQAKVVKSQLTGSLAGNSQATAWGLDVLRDVDLRSELTAIQCDINCLYGKNDVLVPASIQTAMLAIGAQVEVWPDVGHAAFLSDPGKFSNWVRQAINHG